MPRRITGPPKVTTIIPAELVCYGAATPNKVGRTPIVLLIAPIAEADEINGIVTDATFAGGRYGEAVLTVNSAP